MNTLTITTAQIEQEFLNWLRGRRSLLRLAHFQQSIAESDTELPEPLGDEHGYPPGTTVGHAVRCAVAFDDRDGTEYRLETRLAFPSEAESLRWWRANKDNPDRITLRHVGDGRWEMKVALTDGARRVDWKDGF